MTDVSRGRTELSLRATGYSNRTVAGVFLIEVSHVLPEVVKMVRAVSKSDETPVVESALDSDENTADTCGNGVRRGAQAGNRNALRHGLRAGQLPKDAKHIETRMNSFRRQLEDVLIEIKGEVSLVDAASVQTAVRWERHAMLAQRWMTQAYDQLSPSERLSFSREIARASTERDKALSMLELKRDSIRDAWSVIDLQESK